MGTVVWPLGDQVGSVRDLVTYDAENDTTTLASHRNYDSFGNLVSETPNAAVDELFGFTGRMFDVGTGLQNNLNRWYDPGVGKWISEDPIGFGGGDANLSRYVGNSPTSFVDPTGLWSWNPINWIMDYGGGLGTRIGNGIGSWFNFGQNLALNIDAAAPRDLAAIERLSTSIAPDRMLASGERERSPEQLLAERRLSSIRVTLCEAGQDAYNVYDGGVAGIELASDVAMVGEDGAFATSLARNASLNLANSGTAYSMRNVRKAWWGGPAPVRPNPIMPRGREYIELSHTYIPDNGWGSRVPEYIKNRGWNLNPMWGTEHALADPGRHKFMPASWRAANPLPGPLSRLWRRMPLPHRIGAGSAACGAGGYGAYRAVNGSDE